MDRKIYSTKYIAKATDFSERSVRRWTRAGLPCYRTPAGYPRYSLDEVLQWLKENAQRKAEEKLAA